MDNVFRRNSLLLCKQKNNTNSKIEEVHLRFFTSTTPAVEAKVTMQRGYQNENA